MFLCNIVKNIFNMKLVLFVTTILVFVSCKRHDISELTTFSDNNYVHAIIEIPAGSNKKMIFKQEKNTFIHENKNGARRIIDYLPYPVNYGFIPKTEMKESLGGDGDALDVLVLCSALATANFLEVKPVGVLKMKDNGQDDHKILAIPADTKFQTIKAHGLEHMLSDYATILDIIEMWFLNYKGDNQMEVLGWGDEKEALEMIKASQI